MGWFSIQYSLDSVKNDPMAGTLTLMLADYLRDRHSTCTLHCGDTLCLIACPICCERETRRDTYAYIYK